MGHPHTAYGKEVSTERTKMKKRTYTMRCIPSLSGDQAHKRHERDRTKDGYETTYASERENATAKSYKQRTTVTDQFAQDIEAVDATCTVRST
jgi:hypothetical protein